MWGCDLEIFRHRKIHYEVTIIPCLSLEIQGRFKLLSCFKFCVCYESEDKVVDLWQIKISWKSSFSSFISSTFIWRCKYKPKAHSQDHFWSSIWQRILEWRYPLSQIIRQILLARDMKFENELDCPWKNCHILINCLFLFW